MSAGKLREELSGPRLLKQQIYYPQVRSGTCRKVVRCTERLCGGSLAAWVATLCCGCTADAPAGCCMQWLFGEWQVTETFVGTPLMAGAPILAVHSMQVNRTRVLGTLGCHSCRRMLMMHLTCALSS